MQNKRVKYSFLFITIFSCASFSAYACETPFEGFDKFLQIQRDRNVEFARLDATQSRDFIQALGEQCYFQLRQHGAFEGMASSRMLEIKQDLLRGVSSDMTDYHQFVELFRLAPDSAFVEEVQSIQANREQKCTTVENRLSSLPVRDQSDKGWCFAYTAADMLSYKLGKNVSALDLALNSFEYSRLKVRDWNRIGELYSDQFDPNNPITNGDGGSVFQSFLSTELIGGVCLEENLSSYSGDAQELSEILNFFNGDLSFFKNSISEAMQENPEEFSSIVCRAVGEGFNSLFPGDNMQDLERAIADPEAKDIFLAIARKRCQGRRQAFDFDYVSVGFAGPSAGNDVESKPTSQEGFSATIDEALDAGAIAGIFYNPIFMVRAEVDDAQARVFSHASTVVGRKWNSEKKSCEYLIRNSWGSTCDHYNNDVKCEAGNIWVSEAQLEKATRGVQYIK